MPDERISVTVSKDVLAEYKNHKLYKMNAKYDQNLIYNIIKKFSNLKDFYKHGGESVDIAANYAVKETLGIKTDKMINFQSFGCTAFAAKDANDGMVYMGRNYDFATDTSCMCVRCGNTTEKQGVLPYKSIAFAALSSLGIDDPTTCDEDALKLLPFVCLDGINEMGVSIAVLVVDIKEGAGATCQSTNVDNIFTTLAIRLVLDEATSTKHAIALLQNINMFATGGKDYHFFISDAEGNSRIVEYDYRKKEVRSLVETKGNIATNFYVLENGGRFGHGHDRYQKVKDIIDNETVTYFDLWEALKSSSQEMDSDDPTSNTQWSIVFNNTKRCGEISIYRDWGTITKFNVSENLSNSEN